MRRKLGQYFLRSRRVLDAVVGAIAIPSETVVVEVGPGKGALTERILTRHTAVVAVEKDSDLVMVLQERFAGAVAAGRLMLVEGDVRDGAWSGAVAGQSYAVIANIPYYLTGSLIREMLTRSHPPVAMSLVVQKEVAERIVRRGSVKESLLSLSVQLFGTARYVQTVPQRAFSPQPRVDSAIIAITDIQKPSWQVQDVFFRVLKTAFHGKRKTVLKKFADMPNVQTILVQNKVSPTARAEDVPFTVWLAVARSLS